MQTERETVLVTGGAGCVGTQLVRELLEAGYRVKATDLPGRTFTVGGARVQTVLGDLRDGQFVDTLVQGVNHVIHAGAVLDISKPWELLKQVNLDATVRLWDHSVEAGVQCFVFFSSASVYKGQDRPIREDDPLDPPGPYERSKFLAEKALLRSKQGGAATRLVILRPALIIGPFATELMAPIATLPPLFKEYLRWAPRIYGGPKTNIVHALDVARAAVHLLRHGEDGAAYNVASDDVVMFSDMVNVAFEEYGVRLIPLPFARVPSRRWLALMSPLLISRPEVVGVINFVANILWDRLMRKYGLTGRLRPKAYAHTMSYSLRDSVFDTTKLKNTGFEVRFPDYRSIMRDVLDWYRKERWIP